MTTTREELYYDILAFLDGNGIYDYTRFKLVSDGENITISEWNYTIPKPSLDELTACDLVDLFNKIENYSNHNCDIYNLRRSNGGEIFTTPYYILPISPARNPCTTYLDNNELILAPGYWKLLITGITTISVDIKAVNSAMVTLFEESVFNNKIMIINILKVISTTNLSFYVKYSNEFPSPLNLTLVVEKI